MRRPTPTIVICTSEQRADTRWIAAVLVASVTNRDTSVVAAACVRRAGSERSEVRSQCHSATTARPSRLAHSHPSIR